MTDRVRARHDRHLRLAAKVTRDTPEASATKFLRPVLVGGDPAELATREGQLALITAVNLVVRFCPRVDVSVLGSDTLAAEALTLARRIDSSAASRFNLVTAPDVREYAAALHIGRAAPATGYTTSAIGRGWLASVSSLGAAPALDASAAFIPFGPILAACFGAGEVFKRLLDAPPERVAPWGPTVFSAYSHAIADSQEGVGVAPDLHGRVVVPVTLLAGAGAVGNAFVYTLAKVDGVSGTLAVADRQVVGDEDESNLNRYCLAFADDVTSKTPKVLLVTRAFESTGVTCVPFQGEIEKYLELVFSRQEPRPVIVVSAVDNNDVRPSLQRLWPDLLVEGATADSLFQVSRHAYDEGLACLMCIHSGSQRDEDRSPEQAGAELTGLSRSAVAAALRDATRVITDQDVVSAPEGKQEFLRQRIGAPVCSVLAEAANLSRTPDAVPRAPTVSFVSMAAGALAAAEVIKQAASLPTSLETMYQMDTFMPPENAALVPSEKSRACECYTRRGEHDAYRALVARSRDR